MKKLATARAGLLGGLKRKPLLFPSLIAVSLFVSLSLSFITLPVLAQRSDLRLDRGRAKAMLKVVAGTIEKEFYDPNLRGLDWEALKADAEKRINEANSLGQMMTAIYSLTKKIDDSHTAFIPPLRVRNPRFGFELKAFGDEVRISEVKEKSVAEEADLQVGERVLKLNGYNCERHTLFTMLYFFRVLMHVPVMELVVSHNGEEPRTVLLKAKEEWREINIDLTSFDSSDFWDLIRDIEKDRSKYMGNIYEGDIGYIQFYSFSASARFFDGLLKMIEKMIKQKAPAGPKAFIVDLRENQGGAVKSVTALVGFFEPEDTVIGDLIGRKKTEPVKVKRQKPNFDVPLFILVDSDSHSGAEVFARHFQLSGRGVVIGDQTPGHVTVARVFLREMGHNTIIRYATQVAIGRLVFPDGQELEKRGVTPDHLCLPSESDLREDHDPCLDLALDLARKRIVKKLQEMELPSFAELRRIGSQSDGLLRKFVNLLSEQWDGYREFVWQFGSPALLTEIRRRYPELETEFPAVFEHTRPPS